MTETSNSTPIQRRKTRRVHIGEVAVGGGAPISVQTMTKTRTGDVEATLAQIHHCTHAGCDIIRIAVPEAEDAEALRAIVPASPLPIVADIHFDHKLALAALDAGVQGLRLNPGNLRGEERIAQIARKAEERGVPIRVGVNAGSPSSRSRFRSKPRTCKRPWPPIASWPAAATIRSTSGSPKPGRSSVAR